MSHLCTVRAVIKQRALYRRFSPAKLNVKISNKDHKKFCNPLFTLVIQFKILAMKRLPVGLPMSKKVYQVIQFELKLSVNTSYLKHFIF